MNLGTVEGDAAGAPRPVVSLRGISKRFGPIQALKGVDLDIYPGEVLGLLGDNGAGKSTLIKVISGAHPPSDGRMRFGDRDVRVFTPDTARTLGIETIYQDLSLAGNLDVSLNIFLGRELRGRLLGFLPRLQWTRMREEARAALDRLQIHVPSLRAPVETLSGGQQQSVAIARALYWKARLVIMDEPTAALGVSEHETVIRLIRDLAAQGVAVILITHNMDDALSVTDRIVVLTRGEKVLERSTGDLTQADVVHAMMWGRANG